MTKYYLKCTYTQPWQTEKDLEYVLETLEEALHIINNIGDNYIFRLIEGKEVKLKAVNFVTKYVVE